MKHTPSANASQAQKPKSATKTHKGNLTKSKTKEGALFPISLQFQDQEKSCTLTTTQLNPAALDDLAKQAEGKAFKGRSATLTVAQLGDWPTDAQAAFWTLRQRLAPGRTVYLNIDGQKFSDPLDAAVAMLVGADAPAKQFKQRLQSAAQVVQYACTADTKDAAIERF